MLDLEDDMRGVFFSADFAARFWRTRAGQAGQEVVGILGVADDEALQGRVIAAAWSGKLKTGCTMVGLSAMMLFSEVEMVNIIFTVLILITTVGSGIHYFWVNRDVFKC